jgi:hypothetical protein
MGLTIIAIYTPIFIKEYTGLSEMSTASAHVEKIHCL